MHFSQDLEILPKLLWSSPAARWLGTDFYVDGIKYPLKHYKKYISEHLLYAWYFHCMLTRVCSQLLSSNFEFEYQIQIIYYRDWVRVGAVVAPAPTFFVGKSLSTLRFLKSAPTNFHRPIFNVNLKSYLSACISLHVLTTLNCSWNTFARLYSINCHNKIKA